MYSQGVDYHLLKSRRLQYIESHERVCRQSSMPATRASFITQAKLLRDVPANRRGLGDQQPSLAEKPHYSHGKKNTEHLPHIASSAKEDWAPDPKVSLSVVSQKIFQGNSIKRPERSLTFAGHTGLLKNDPETTTAGEAQENKRTTALLSTARKQMEKASSLVDARLFLGPEMGKNTENPSQKWQQQKILEDLRGDHLGGGEGIERLKQPQEPHKYCKPVAPLEEDNFLQSKKIKPHSRHPGHSVSPLSAGEQEAGEEHNKSVPSGQGKLEDKNVFKASESQYFFWKNTFLHGNINALDQNLRVEAKPQLLHRRKMQALEMPQSHQDREVSVAHTREKVQLSPYNLKHGASRENIKKHKRQAREEGWDPAIEGTPVVLAAREHSCVQGGSKDHCAPKTKLRA
ncbi:protein Tex24-like [Acomys russatus]|uniref:protein Tex24-like n=1 Tax=Acomys russatus TaxID=60746 RepID=UPI0021E2ECF9|nr:protein Tex24-like [Acomys russatus]